MQHWKTKVANITRVKFKDGIEIPRKNPKAAAITTFIIDLALSFDLLGPLRNK